MQLLTYACSSCRIDSTATSLEESFGSVLCEVPVPAGDEQFPGRYDEERPPRHSGCMPSLLHEDVSDREDWIVRCFPENPTPKAVGRGAAAMSDGLGRRPNRRQVGVGRYGHSISHIDQERGRKSRTST